MAERRMNSVLIFNTTVVDIQYSTTWVSDEDASLKFMTFNEKAVGISGRFMVMTEGKIQIVLDVLPQDLEKASTPIYV